jgi:hypothetical protein
MFYLFLTFWLLFEVPLPPAKDVRPGDRGTRPEVRVEQPALPGTYHINCCGPLPPPPPPPPPPPDEGD